MKNYLGLDLGSRTVGIAISQSGIIANTLETYRFKENQYDVAIDYVIKRIKELQISDVVIGFPKHMNNDIGERGHISELFKSKLLEKTQINIVLWDERLSTKSAMMVMRGFNSKEKKAKKDELAAVLILQNYLDYINN